eukprot:CAMPEP_0113583764 /NCGR_PEP_ID=MMETSP0015_2-20120614/32708_1 /TAXON_ID=2838 /ORGANISM="Odontella" /LENGTH=51 /DNA_ID=CAMNT_0000488697 /DNA_START=436 /DNA_END=588 /DNA_ORIENTATION=+ /assembly_acc=CAM_ASM_000160
MTIMAMDSCSLQQRRNEGKGSGRVPTGEGVKKRYTATRKRILQPLGIKIEV